MPRKEKTDKQLDVIQDKRDKIVVRKSHEFIQKARYDFSPREWRLVSYAMTKIKKTDTADTEYTFDFSDLYDLCGLSSESYTEMKIILKALADKSWWLPIIKNGKECESLVRWFNTVDTDKRGKKVTFKFHERMTPYIFGLFERYEQYGEYYASLMLKYSLPMSKKYSPRLYELLMSYRINNTEWRFSVVNLKRLLNCEKYKAWKDFRARSLDPAVEEINKYTDISVYYEITDKTGKRVDEITFYMAEKTLDERIQAEKDGMTKLEGNIHYWDCGQMSLLDGDEVAVE